MKKVGGDVDCHVQCKNLYRFVNEIREGSSRLTGGSKFPVEKRTIAYVQFTYAYYTYTRSTINERNKENSTGVIAMYTAFTFFESSSTQLDWN